MSIFYEIIAPNGKKNFLFGTVHSCDAEILTFPIEVKNALDSSSRCLVEANPLDVREIRTMQAACWLNWWKKESENLKKEAFSEEYIKSAREHSILTGTLQPERELKIHTVPPIEVAFHVLNTFEKEESLVVLNVLDTQIAKFCENKLFFLESIQNAIERFYGLHLTAEEQLEFFNATHAAVLENRVVRFKDIKQAYLAEDLKALKPGLWDENSPPAVQKYYEKFITAADLIFAESMIPHLNEGNAFAAVGASHLSGIVKLLQEKNYKINSISLSKRMYPAAFPIEQALFAACIIRNLEAVNEFIKQDPALMHQTLEGYTLFHIASEFGALEIAKTLLRKNKEFINQLSANGFTPLHLACQNNHLELVLFLIEQGAEINKTTPEGATALHIACEQGHVNVVSELLKNDVNVNYKDEHGSTPFHFACDFGDINVVKLLLEGNQQVEIDAIDEEHNTPLHYACFSENTHEKTELFQLLLSYGASITHKDILGETALAIAFSKENKEAVLEIIHIAKNKELSIHSLISEDRIQKLFDWVRTVECFKKSNNITTPYNFFDSQNQRNSIGVNILSNTLQ